MAKGITEAVVEEVKGRIDLAELIASYGIQIKTSGATKKACCPFHHEKTPSFNINERKGFYHCFGCGESGDAIKFVMKMEGLTFGEAVKKLGERCGVRVEETEDPHLGRRRRLIALLAELAAFYRRCLKQSKAAQLARDYLVKRDLGEKIQDDYLIGYAPVGVATIRKWAEKYKYTDEELEAAGIIKAPNRPGDQGYHRFGGRLMFSIRDKRGEVVGFSGRQLVESKNSGKYVNSPETEVFKKSKILYGFDKAAGAIAKSTHHEAIVCEGQIDCIRLQTSGFGNSVAGQGTAFTEEHVKMLKRVAEQVTLVYDDDGAGHKATIKSARLCLAAGLPVKTVSLPNGDDPDSFLRAHPAADFQALLDNANSIIAFQLRAERAKEKNPDSVDAVARVTKEILLTIATCSNEVMKASMVDELAKLTRLPRTALAEELRKVKIAPGESSRPEAAEETVDAAALPEVEAVVLPPSDLEMAFCAFLMANEYDQTLEGMVGEFLPEEVFAHKFTARFAETWRTEVVGGSDLMQKFAAGLKMAERKWFDAVLLESGKSQASGLTATDILQEFVRSLWAEALKRRRGELPAKGDKQADLERLRITQALKYLSSERWGKVKEIIRAIRR